MSMVKSPCPKDCPRRHAFCGAECPEWAAYEAERNKGYVKDTTASVSDDYNREKRSKYWHQKMRSRRH
jgi:hypothetical protein